MVLVIVSSFEPPEKRATDTLRDGQGFANIQVGSRQRHGHNTGEPLQAWPSPKKTDKPEELEFYLLFHYVRKCSFDMFSS